MWGRGEILVVLLLASILERQASVFTPPMFIAQEPQMPSLQLLLKVRLGSISFLILMRASSTMGPQLLRSTLYSSILGLSPGFSGAAAACAAPLTAVMKGELLEVRLRSLDVALT